jgi:methyl-accepting chemotaxis protein
MRKKIAITLIVTLIGLIYFSYDYQVEKKREYNEVMLINATLFHDKAAQVENAMLQIYQGARTISLLPTMKAMTGSNLPKGFIEKKKYDVTRFSPDAQNTVQQIYNNLINNISASEVYAVLKGFKPENGETPFFMFDKLAYEANSNPAEEGEKSNDTPEMSEEEEYSYYTKELKNIEEKYSHYNLHKDGINNIPMTVSSLMRTCDNSQYSSKSKGNVNDTLGILFNVPFYKHASDEFLGLISVVIRSNVFEALLVGVPYIPITEEEIQKAKDEKKQVPAKPVRFQLSSPELNIAIADRRLDKDFTSLISDKDAEGIISEKLHVPGHNSWILKYSVDPELLSKIRNKVFLTFLKKLLGLFVFAGFLIYSFIQTEKQEQERKKIIEEAMKSYNMLEKFPINIMTATPTGILTYVNKNSINTLNNLQQYLPGKVENYLGSSIDMFHKNPEVIKRIISDPKNLPYNTIIAVGPEKIDLSIVAIFDQEGMYQGPMVTWSIVTNRVNLIRDLTQSSSDLGEASTSVLGISSTLSAAAEETSAQANTASVASEEVNAGVQTVANNMEAMVSAIKEITKTTNEAAAMTNEAMRVTQNTNAIISKLGESSLDIGNVIKVISSIAQQTNLLALNATIEAARAGEAGKGFAVVANEVKELANQTAKATQEITKKIETIQADSKSAVEAINEISSAIEKVNGYTANIAASVEVQAATTHEVTRIVTQSAEGVKQISENINQVSQAAASTGKDAGSVQEAAKDVGSIAEKLKSYVAKLTV